MYFKQKPYEEIQERTRIVFRTDNYEGVLYKSSPYSVGSKLWNALPVILEID